MTAILASVRDVFEAGLVLDCGVDWIDVKDPHGGALGAATATAIADIVRHVDGRRPVSATIGDTWSTPQVLPARVTACAAGGVDYVKAGLDARNVDDRTLELVAHAARAAPLIVVCRAEAPPRVADVEALAAQGIAGIMLDTADKQGPGLTALHGVADLLAFTRAARASGLLCGLAGRLRLADVAILRPLGADYLGFRGALCHDGERGAHVDRGAVLTLVAALHDDAAAREVRLP